MANFGKRRALEEANVNREKWEFRPFGAYPEKIGLNIVLLVNWGWDPPPGASRISTF